MMAVADEFVVDASVALSWCFDDEATPLTEAILDRVGTGVAHAPAIWPFEVANGLRSAERRGRIDEAVLPTVARLLTGLRVSVDATAPLGTALGPILDLARRLGLSAYDAAYVELAVRRGLPLATVDDQLARAALAAGIELFEPPIHPPEEHDAPLPDDHAN